MTQANPAKLTDLIGSRICHDLISPLGAIGNGLELLEMSGMARETPEMAMIADSVENANARVKFFRIAFGATAPGQMISLQEIRRVLADISKGGRATIVWETEGDADRAQAKLAFLLIMCAETAMPRGGTISVRQSGNQWVVTALSAHLNIDPDLWSSLSTNSTPTQVAPAMVQFALAPSTAADLGRNLAVCAETDRLSITF